MLVRAVLANVLHILDEDGLDLGFGITAFQSLLKTSRIDLQLVVDLVSEGLELVHLYHDIAKMNALANEFFGD